MKQLKPVSEIDPIPSGSVLLAQAGVKRIRFCGRAGLRCKVEALVKICAIIP